MNPSDIGTKYQTFSDQHRHKMLNFTECGPTSVMYNGMPWMRNFDKFLANKTIKTARYMKETQTSYTLNQEEKKEYYNGFKSDQTEKIGNTETII